MDPNTEDKIRASLTPEERMYRDNFYRNRQLSDSKDINYTIGNCIIFNTMQETNNPTLWDKIVFRFKRLFRR